eukprot:TRINITY_DN44319_c0_g1_i1.p2 TRINITY_DN44319_c0_g1~~TRINITY_DN44319_c0_g1_i1.p2  ORF type:complete len:101 (-),score=31.50 TRINITY_DN44319_c0_g1_i1:72-374(-)
MADTGKDLLAEAESLGLVAPEEDNEGHESGEDLTGGGCEDASGEEPLFRIGQVVKMARDEGNLEEVEVLHVDKTDMGPVYAIKFKGGLVQSLVAQCDLQP